MEPPDDETRGEPVGHTRVILYSTKNKILIAAALLVATVGFGLAIFFTADPDSEVALTGAQNSAGAGQNGQPVVIVEAYIPGRGVEAFQQAQVGLDLASGWTLSDFTLNGVAIPEEELDIGRQLDRYVYTPGDGKTVEALDPQTNCASAVITPVNTDTNAGSRTERWCFEVL